MQASDIGTIDDPNAAALATRLVPDFCATSEFEPGEPLRQRGVHYSNMYLILRGRVEVELDGRDRPVVMGAGSPVGEIGFMRGCRATGTAIAVEPTLVLVLDDVTLWRIERQLPRLSVTLLRAIARTAQERLDRDATLLPNDEPDTPQPLEILLCRDEDSLLPALQLRYQVYCRELGRSSPYADHQRELIRDNLDDFGHTFIARDPQGIVGTLRANFSTDGDLGTLEQLYGMDESPLHPEQTMLCTKFIVDKSRRGGPASRALIGAVRDFVLNSGRDTRQCFIDCIPELIPLYRRIGFEPTGEMFYHYENGPSMPMVMAL